MVYFVIDLYVSSDREEVNGAYWISGTGDHQKLQIHEMLSGLGPPSQLQDWFLGAAGESL